MADSSDNASAQPLPAQVREQHERLARILTAAMAAADPRPALSRATSPRGEGRSVLLAAGKSAGQMTTAWSAFAAESHDALVVTRYGHADDVRSELDGLSFIEAAHPTPDANSLEAGRRALAMAEAMAEGDLLVLLLSGGASSLLFHPVAGVSLEDARALINQLLRSGAPVSDINCVRKKVTRLGGGKLAAAAWPARSVAYIISDVVGDQLSDVASGPTLADPSTLADARAVVTRWNVAVPPAIEHALNDPANETPKPGDPCLARSEAHLLLCNRDALSAAADAAQREGYEPIILSDRLEGEARGLGRQHAERALEARRSGRRCALISGGEATVTVSGADGRGGPNTEFLLGFALEANGADGLSAGACDTDGIDGNGDNAGGFADPGLLARAQAAGLNPSGELARNNAYAVFQAAASLFTPGPTGTNVNDVRVVLVEPAPGR